MKRWKRCRYCDGTKVVPKLYYPDGTPDKRGEYQVCGHCVGGFETQSPQQTK